MRKILITAILLMGASIIPGRSSAQANQDPPAANAVPIDGGLSLLIGAGVLYGVKKVRGQRKKNTRSAIQETGLESK